MSYYLYVIRVFYLHTQGWYTDTQYSLSRTRVRVVTFLSLLICAFFKIK